MSYAGIHYANACLLLFYALATSKVILGRILTCDSTHSKRLYSPASLEHQATGTMTCYPTQSHYPNTEPTSPLPFLIMPNVSLGSDKYQWNLILKLRFHIKGLQYTNANANAACLFCSKFAKECQSS